MEDIPLAESPPLDDMLEAGNDSGDPLTPEIEEENSTLNPPIADPTLDEEVIGTNEVDKDGMSDVESELSEVDERQFEDFDPTAIAIEDRPAIAVDENTVNQLGKHKKKRVEGEEPRKKKEKRREKPKKIRRRREGTEEFEGGQTIDGKRARKSKPDGESSRRRVHEEEDDESLTPEERRKKALDRKIDAALRNPNQRRGRKDGVVSEDRYNRVNFTNNREQDLEQFADKEIERIRDAMISACQEDASRRSKGLPAMKKLELLPQVKSLLNRTQLATQLVDPEINLLEAVKFFLEPLSPDGILPAYSIQRELFAALAKLPINKQSLISSGIGKVIIFYTKSRQPEEGIKRQAEKLLSNWMRLILNRSDDYRKRKLATATYDPLSVMHPRKKNEPNSLFASRLAMRPNSGSQAPLAAAEANAARDAALARPAVATNRARVEGGVGVYTVVPKSTVNMAMPVARAPGQSGEEAFRKLKARQQGKIGGGRSRG